MLFPSAVVVALSVVFFLNNATFAFQTAKLPCRKMIKMSGDLFEESNTGNTALAADSLMPDRYIASNRFNVKKDKGPAFEKRWADRKSRLAELEGFRFFSLLKRVQEDGSNYENTELGE
jgi:hypothetical protein